MMNFTKSPDSSREADTRSSPLESSSALFSSTSRSKIAGEKGLPSNGATVLARFACEKPVRRPTQWPCCFAAGWLSGSDDAYAGDRAVSRSYGLQVAGIVEVFGLVHRGPKASK
jgi:hypothetical protein